MVEIVTIPLRGPRGTDGTNGVDGAPGTDGEQMFIITGMFNNLFSGSGGGSRLYGMDFQYITNQYITIIKSTI